MKLRFDIRGNLQPYERVQVNIQEFKYNFVDSFDESSTRHDIFKKYSDYTESFKSKVTDNFIQWINGSFVTNKRNPSDMDFVNLVDFSVVEEKEEVIRKEFIRSKALRKYGLDPYLLIIYPKKHKFQIYTESDLAYWNDWFTKGRKNKRGVRHPKGYIELEIKQKAQKRWKT